jgi:hypothetical protein
MRNRILQLILQFVLLSWKEVKAKWNVSYSISTCIKHLNVLVKDNRRSFYVLDCTSLQTHGTLKKSNSCSTIFLDDSTISQPNLKNTIKCISLAIYYHILNRKHRSQERLMEIFEERIHPISVIFFLFPSHFHTFI